MIYICDNGMEYSAHEVAFYELPDSLPKEDAIWLIENQPAWPWSVIGVVEKVEWREHAPSPFPMVGDLARTIRDRGYGYRAAADWFKRVPKHLLTEWLKRADTHIMEREPQFEKEGDYREMWKHEVKSLHDLKRWNERREDA